MDNIPTDSAPEWEQIEARAEQIVARIEQERHSADLARQLLVHDIAAAILQAESDGYGRGVGRGMDLMLHAAERDVERRRDSGQADR